MKWAFIVAITVSFSNLIQADGLPTVFVSGEAPTAQQFNENFSFLETQITKLRQELASRVDIVESGNVPVGTIIAWYGAEDGIPKGWRLCNGDNGTPDLTNKFLMGVDRINKIGITGGLNSIAAGTTGGHTLTINEIPTHAHGYQDQSYAINNGGISRGGKGGHADTARTTGSAGANGAHSHSIPAYDNRPNFVGIVYLMKVD